MSLDVSFTVAGLERWDGLDRRGEGVGAMLPLPRGVLHGGLVGSIGRSFLEEMHHIMIGVSRRAVESIDGHSSGWQGLDPGHSIASYHGELVFAHG